MLGFGDNFDGGAGTDRVTVSLAGRTSGVILDLTTDAVARLAGAANATYANVEFLNNRLRKGGALGNVVFKSSNGKKIALGDVACVCTSL
jgi:multidrug efflux pump subunit AcrB